MEIVRPGQPDLDNIMALVAAVGWPHRTQDVVPLLSHGNLFGVRDERSADLTGIAAWWPFGQHFARVGLVIVAPDRQGNGLGRILMKHVLEDLTPRAVFLLATAEGQPLYEALGFTIRGRFQKHLGPYAASPVPDHRIGVVRTEEMPDLLALDHAALGVPRQPLIEEVIAAGQTLVLKRDRQVCGYVVTRPFGTGQVIGPVVAESEDDAIALFRAVARPGILRVDRPVVAEAFGHALEQAGVIGHEVANEMTLGAWPADSDSLRVFAMASHAWA